MKKINLALAEDYEIMRDGLSLILETFPHYNLLYAAKDGQELIDMMGRHETLPDVVLMDVDMPQKNGFDTCKYIHQHFPEVSVIFLTNHISKRFIEEAVLSGGNGYLAKNSDINTIGEAIDQVIECGHYYNEFWSVDIIKSLIQKGKIKHHFDNGIVLSDRELEVLLAICAEKTDAQIAEQLFMSPLTAESHRKSLLKKIGVKKSVGLAIFAVKNQLI